MTKLGKEWDMRFLRMAATISHFSKDPSTKVGALIARPSKEIVSLGYNGFPRGLRDDARLGDRAQKYSLIIHAEENALLYAKASLEGCTLYCWPFSPCSRCAVKIIQTGVKRIVAPNYIPERWAEDFKLSKQAFIEAHVEVQLYGRYDLIDMIHAARDTLSTDWDQVMNHMKPYTDEVHYAF